MISQTANYIIGEAAFAVDKRGIVVSWNSAAEKMFNYPASSALGRRCWKLMDGKDVFGNRYCSESCPLREMALQHESAHSFEVSFKTASNGYKKIKLNCISVFGGPGDELLLHICNHSDETPEYPEKKNNHALIQPPAMFKSDNLTSRELEVMALLAEGKNTKEISSLLRVSCATVRNHIQHTLRKLHVHTRLEAVVLGRRLNLF